MGFEFFKDVKTVAGMFTDSASAEMARKAKLAQREKEIDRKAADKQLGYLAQHLPALAKEAGKEGNTVVAYGAYTKYKDENDDTDSSQWKFARGYIPVPVEHNAFRRLDSEEIKALPGYAILEQAAKDKGVGVHLFRGFKFDDKKDISNSLSLDFQPGTTRWSDDEIPHPITPKL